MYSTESLPASIWAATASTPMHQVIAFAVALLFTGRYPQGIFDLVVIDEAHHLRGARASKVS